ncbi:MAG: hypothetical protein ACOCVP_01990 [Wenzhouxiangella sp.]
MQPQRPVDWRAQRSEKFVFAGYEWSAERGSLALSYQLDGIDLCERFVFPLPQAASPINAEALAAAFDLLHWTAGISYWKAGCPQKIVFAGPGPDRRQAAWLNQLYNRGLAEFAYRQGLSSQAFEVFASDRAPPSAVPRRGLDDRLLVPMGGGKDSLVAWSRLDRVGRVAGTLQVGQARLIGEVAARTGSPHWCIQRRVDPQLAALNVAGAYNGHVPVTAINAAAAVVLALLHGHGGVAFANERSADEPTLIDEHGAPVNHQFAKTLIFERMLNTWVRHYVAADLAVFSLLRRDRELAVCAEFAELDRFHDVFSSCNRNFHLDGPRTERWCGECPKCRFVYLALAPFMSIGQLHEIFGADLLDDRRQIDGFRRLLGLDGQKPFECVGEADEARAAIRALAQRPGWSEQAVVRALAPLLEGIDVPALEALCQSGGPHLIPEALLHAT